MKKILVIEDEPIVRSNILELLEGEDYDAVGAENGVIGAMSAREHLPDLIICDVMMPELDGYGVLTALRQDPATATIPFCRALSSSRKYSSFALFLFQLIISLGASRETKNPNAAR